MPQKKSSEFNCSELGGRATDDPPPTHLLGTLWLKRFLTSFTGSKAVDSLRKGYCGYGKPPHDALFIPQRTVTTRYTKTSPLHAWTSALTQLRRCISVAPRVPFQTVLFLATQFSLYRLHGPCTHATPAVHITTSRKTREHRPQYQLGVRIRHRTRNISTRAVEIQHSMSQATLIISKKLILRKGLLMRISDIPTIFARAENNPRNQWLLGLFVTHIKEVSFRNVVIFVKWRWKNSLLMSFFIRSSTDLWGLGLLIVEVSRSHSDTPHSVGLHWANDPPVADNSTWQHTQHSQEADIHTAVRIQTRNPSKRVAADPHLKHPGHSDRLLINVRDIIHVKPLSRTYMLRTITEVVDEESLSLSRPCTRHGGAVPHTPILATICKCLAWWSGRFNSGVHWTR
jgi:hypothetical protein